MSNWIYCKLLVLSTPFILFILAETFFYKGQYAFVKTACTSEIIESVLRSRLVVDSFGKIYPLSNFSECLRVNKSEDGIGKFMLRENFISCQCVDIVNRTLENNNPSKKTALASMPGSGNTWVRHLIEEATGLYTGSVYCDKRLKGIFKGECHTEGQIAIKTHKDWNLDKYDRAILIVRDPFESTLAEYNLMISNSHIEILSETKFDRTRFKEELKNALGKWLRFNEDWILSFHGPVFVLYYNMLKSDLRNSLAKLSFFLGVNITLQDLWCVGLNREGSFHRPPKPNWMSRSKLVNAALETRIKMAKQRIFDICLNPKNRNKISSNL